MSWSLIMQRSSDSIAALAGALAKAQLELTNPEKSLVATIRSPFPRKGDKTFRYTPLSTGLDIVRKTLGKHEIAFVQTTGVDRDAGLVRLTTVLAHSSGEWVSSDWPVCAISDIAAPHKMGAALTYARRYALFTLAGIAGEDDVDAADLPISVSSDGPVNLGDPARMNGGAANQNTSSIPVARNKMDRKRTSSSAVLGADDSGAIRDKLIDEVVALASADAALAWAIRRISMKSRLAAQDASAVERAFQGRVQVLAPDAYRETSPSGSVTAAEQDAPQLQPTTSASGSLAVTSEALMGESQSRKQLDGGDQSSEKAVSFLFRPRRSRDKDHLRFIAIQPCTVCGRQPCEAHHIRYAQPRALGRKVSDEFTVPLCRVHHRELHRQGDELAWWSKFNIDPMPIALKFWRYTRGVPSAATNADRGSSSNKGAENAAAELSSETSQIAGARKP
jgi:hypothetical protein